MHFLVAASLALCLLVGCAHADVTLIDNGTPKAAIYVAAAVMAPNQGDVLDHYMNQAMTPEAQRRRLRESVNDLAHYLEKIAGGKLPIITDPATKPDPGVVPIYIGDRATAVFGPVGKTYPFQQAFRLVVSSKEPPGVGLLGESDLAVTYAIYELLHRLGCRWFMPSEMGECIPRQPSITLADLDFASAPGTLSRAIWYADDAYRRRNRMGGLYLASGDALEYYITKEDREQHPDWRATVDGQPAPFRLKWSNPEVANAIAQKILAQQKTTPSLTVSLSPGDGLGWDNSPEDRALDAGDFDEIFNDISITDRLMVICNRIAKQVNAEHPDIYFGLLAYANYLRPPVREKVDPHIVPHIAPIGYARAHPMNDDRVPGNRQLRQAIESWPKHVDKTAFWFYGWFLAEPVAPNPMLSKWGHDVPYVLQRGACKFWQPETQANFETSMHALYMSIRLAFEPQLQPEDIYREINERFYGAAAAEMTAYWQYIDQVWTGIDVYAGCGFGHLRRWSPEKLAEARRLLDAAKAAAQTDAEKSRIGLADESLRLFSDFMQLRRDLAEGRFAGLTDGAKAWRKQVWDLANKYRPQFAFTYMPFGTGRVLTDEYFAWFYEPTYLDAARIARDCTILTPQPIRQFRWLADPEKKGEQAGYFRPDFPDSEWKTTDVCMETWSSLGLHDYFKSLWYRTTVKLPAVTAGKKVQLWIGSTDGSAKLFVNGRHIPYQPPPAADAKTPAEPKPEARGYCSPFSFDITAALDAAGGDTHIAILCTRTDLNELGTGGLLAPVVIYAEK